jgi:purine nucleosidase
MRTFTAVKRALIRAGIVVIALVTLAVTTLFMPVKTWRTGRLPSAPLALRPGEHFASPAARIWIDTDAACGAAPRTDPDDCFAVLALAGAPSIEIAGISTVFGNAPLDVTDRVTRELVAQITRERTPIAVFRGSARRSGDEAPAHDALRAALRQEPLTVVALGPLTNIAAALRTQPSLRTRIMRIVAVMGRRPGHVFHPTEGKGGAMLFGHGPIFSDLNFVSDPEAAAEIIRMRVPLALVPYDAARGIELTATDLERMREAGGASAWVAERASDWLAFWREDVGRAGFYPFDLVGASFAIDPEPLRCARVPIRAGDDARFRWPFREQAALLAGPDALTTDAKGATGSAVYCPEIGPDLKERLFRELISNQRAPAEASAAPHGSR